MSASKVEPGSEVGIVEEDQYSKPLKKSIKPLPAKHLGEWGYRPEDRWFLGRPLVCSNSMG